MTNKHRGTSFDSFLEQEGILDKVETTATSRVIAYKDKIMKKNNNNKVKTEKKS